MKKLFYILICFLIIFTQSNLFCKSDTDYQNEADDLYNRADVFKNQYNFNEALNLYNQFLETEKKCKNPRYNIIMNALNEIGNIYYYQADYKKALVYYEEILKIAKQTSNDFGTAIGYNNIAMINYMMGEYETALTNYFNALQISEKLGRMDAVVIGYMNMGMVYSVLTEFEDAVVYYEKAYELAKELNLKTYMPVILNSYGTVYYAWGKYDKAIDYYNKSMDACIEVNDMQNFIFNLHRIGEIYLAWGKYDEALKKCSAALEYSNQYKIYAYLSRIYDDIGRTYYALNNFDMAVKYFTLNLEFSEKSGKKQDIELALNSLGMVYHKWGILDKAIEYYEKAYKIAKELNIKGDISRLMILIGGIYQANGDDNKALSYFFDALKMTRETGIIEDESSCLLYIGICYFRQKKYNEAVDYFNKTIAIKEQLRLTAIGDIRRDYLASQIQVYQRLILAYVYNNDPENAFNALESSKAKYLIEKMGERINEKDLKFNGIKNYQKQLDDDTAVIAFSNILWNNPVVIIADKTKVIAKDINNEKFINSVNKKFGKIISSHYSKLRGLKKKVDEDENLQYANDFEKIITYYHSLIANPSSSKDKIKSFKYISQELYKFLFSDVENVIHNKKKLIIIPDGILSYIPFEALIADDNKYLVEKFNIKYAQSLNVQQIIDKRVYPDDRDNIIAFGGAVYKEETYKEEMITTDQELDNLIAETIDNINRGLKVKMSYNELGFPQWQNLPATLKEVEAISMLFKDAKVYKGKDVKEDIIKKMSDSGELKKFKIIHFSTHGIVVPEIPELSALVLSQVEDENLTEDGYLNMKEIAQLDIQADLVNLSACETGLGKIYGGEGVVGLTQGFLIAGANGLSVSLWQVADESTMKFMLALYLFIREKNLSYEDAMTEVKRAFIQGLISTEPFNETRGLKIIDKEDAEPNKYSDPFYWAPFIYYGK